MCYRDHIFKHINHTYFLNLALIIALPFTVFTKSEATPADALQTIKDSTFSELISRSHSLSASENFAEISEALWRKYIATARLDTNRMTQHQNRSLTLDRKIMRFSMSKTGQKPEKGYPLYIALHGGGTAPTSVNDSQWQHMQIYYKDSVKNGIYVAPRGITDTWNLHFVNESYSLYDLLIENMIAYEGVDANRVYLLGFSAGGDGVYQIAPRTADRWAAANMSAGHHNGVTFDNLFNTPFLIQVGENDAAYNRNRVAAKNYATLTNLQKDHGGYVHDAFIHFGGYHNTWKDNDSSGKAYAIIKNPIAWLNQGDRSKISKDTNAVHWLKQHTRSSHPAKIIWDTKTSAPRLSNIGANYISNDHQRKFLSQPKWLFYWLDLNVNEPNENSGKIVAQIDKQNNSINIPMIEGVRKVRVLIHADMLNLKQPITIKVQDQDIPPIHLKPNLAVMSRTLLERGDLNYIFPGEITIAKDETGIWHEVQE